MSIFQSLSVLITLFLLSFSSVVFAIDLYVDTKTKQIFAEPGEGRVHLGEFQRVERVPDNRATQPQHSNIKATERIKTTSSEGVSNKPTQSSKASITLSTEGIKFKSADGNFKFKLGGRLQADASFSRGDNFYDADGKEVEANDGTEIRRANLVFKAEFLKDWAYITKIDFANNKVNIKDLNLRYKGLGFVEIIAGAQKQPFSRELQERLPDLVFIERSVLSAITYPIAGRAIGLNLFSYSKNTTAQLGIFGDTIYTNKRTYQADEGWSVVSRITHAPLLDLQKNRIINLGLSGNYRESDDGGDVRGKPLKFSPKTTHMSNLALIKASIKNVERLAMVGGDVMAVMGPFSLGGEYAHIWIDRKKGEPGLAFNGWYGEAAWVITGESRIYKKGTFIRIKPKKNFSLSKGTWGAWELAVRYGHLDLNHHAFKGGELDNLSVALNWYLNPVVRLMAGYDKVLDVKDSKYYTRNGKSPEGTDTFSFRTQIDF